MVPAQQPSSPPEEPSLLEAIFGSQKERRSSGRGRALSLGLALASLAHVGLYLIASKKEPSLETWTAKMAALVHADLAAGAPTQVELPPPSPSTEPELREPSPQEPQSEPEPQKAQSEQHSPIQAPPSHPNPTPTNTDAPPSSSPASPARAADILAAENALGPVDLTEETFVVGSANAYVGGATTPTGRGRTALGKNQVAHDGTPAAEKSTGGAGKRGERSRAQPVQLPAGSWNCAWPRAALDQDIYEQAVLLRVRVRPNGTVDTASLLEDPGHGFGTAALACARRTHFSPALNESGQPILATSPPIRVRFTR